MNKQVYPKSNFFRPLREKINAKILADLILRQRWPLQNLIVYQKQCRVQFSSVIIFRETQHLITIYIKTISYYHNSRILRRAFDPGLVGFFLSTSGSIQWCVYQPQPHSGLWTQNCVINEQELLDPGYKKSMVLCVQEVLSSFIW